MDRDRKTYHWCAVPQCASSSTTTPEKIFISVPYKAEVRNKWLQLAGRSDAQKLAPNSNIFLCEDHFDLPNDMENYIEYQIMGTVKKIRMRPGCRPSKFYCQRKCLPKSTANLDMDTIKRQTYYLNEEAETSAELFTSQKENSVFGKESVQNQNSSVHRTDSKSNTETQDPLEIKPDEAIQCRFCGQFSKDCVAVSSHKPYLAGQKTALAINHIRIELDFSNDSLPTTVCRHCDTKLHEICEFVKQVNVAQFSLLTVSQKVNTQIVKAEFHDKDEIDTLKLPEVENAKKTTIKRKSYDKGNNISKKKAKTKIETEFIMDIDIKEEIFDDVNGQNPEYSDTGTDVKPSESELDNSALVYRMSETSDLCNFTKNSGKSKIKNRGLSGKT